MEPTANEQFDWIFWNSHFEDSFDIANTQPLGESWQSLDIHQQQQLYQQVKKELDPEYNDLVFKEVEDDTFLDSTNQVHCIDHHHLYSTCY